MPLRYLLPLKYEDLRMHDIYLFEEEFDYGWFQVQLSTEGKERKKL